MKRHKERKKKKSLKKSSWPFFWTPLVEQKLPAGWRFFAEGNMFGLHGYRLYTMSCGMSYCLVHLLTLLFTYLLLRILDCQGPS